jgi:hypothetical protein
MGSVFFRRGIQQFQTRYPEIFFILKSVSECSVGYQVQLLSPGYCTLRENLSGEDMDDNESVERLWELAEETFENAKESLNEAIEADYQFTLDDLDKIVPDIIKKVFMMGFITGLETQLFSEDDDDGEEE